MINTPALGMRCDHSFAGLLVGFSARLLASLARVTCSSCSRDGDGRPPLSHEPPSTTIVSPVMCSKES